MGMSPRSAITGRPDTSMSRDPSATAAPTRSGVRVTIARACPAGSPTSTSLSCRTFTVPRNTRRSLSVRYSTRAVMGEAGGGAASAAACLGDFTLAPSHQLTPDEAIATTVPTTSARRPLTAHSRGPASLDRPESSLLIRRPVMGSAWPVPR
jgi:hypothetical protein